MNTLPLWHLHALALFAVIILPVSAWAATDGIKIGDASISFPDSGALVRSRNNDVLHFAQTTMAPKKRLLAIWVDRSQPAVKSTYFPTHYRYADAYTMRGLEQLDASTANFSEVKDMVRGEINQAKGTTNILMPRDLDELQSKLRKMHIDPERGFSLGVISTTMIRNDSHALSNLVLGSIASNDSTSVVPKRWLLMCTNVLLIRKKIVTLNVFSEFTRPDDRKWVEVECKSLVGAMLSANSF